PPGGVVLGALQKTPDDVNLHIIFFGMDPKEQTSALDQFGMLERVEHFRDSGRTPGKLWPGVRDAKALADSVAAAMLPRVYYRREETGGGSRRAGRLLVTLPDKGYYEPTPPLARGDYELLGLRERQRLRLDPADRVILRAQQRGGKFD